MRVPVVVRLVPVLPCAPGPRPPRQLRVALIPRLAHVARKQQVGVYTSRGREQRAHVAREEHIGLDAPGVAPAGECGAERL